jgi:hypothetical protein
MDGPRSWVGKARRFAISAFLIGHLGATSIWIAPRCPIRIQCYDALMYYMYPTGLWQYWTMFSPDPQRDSMTLEAVVTDVHGLRHLYAFTRVADYSWWAGIPKFRHPKFAANLGYDDLAIHRKIASRHAVRQLDLGEADYPLDIKLLYQFRATPRPGTPYADPLAPTRPYVVASYHFTGIDEVRH